ncbi:hypothetical protein A3Q35_05150 [Aeribacillus pallidus]|nr:hypothetical protein A3Q35_05150 [Aeribacillus pallidus]
MEGFNRFISPGLAAFAFFFSPSNWLPIWCKNQISAGTDFNTVSAWFINVNKVCLVDGVLAWGKFNINVMVNKKFAALTISDMLSTAKAIWCRRPFDPVASSVYTRSYDLLVALYQTAALWPSFMTICSVKRRPKTFSANSPSSLLSFLVLRQQYRDLLIMQHCFHGADF